jgi:hypothetical protein
MLSDWGVAGLSPLRRPGSRPKVNRMLYGLPFGDPSQEATTIRVRMVKTMRATTDGGRTSILCEAGQEYDLPEWLAEAFFTGGEADPAEAHQMADAYENKRLTAAGLVKGPAVAHSGAVNDAATELKDEAKRRAGEDDEPAAVARPARRPRGPGRVPR